MEEFEYILDRPYDESRFNSDEPKEADNYMHNTIALHFLLNPISCVSLIDI